MRMSNFVVRDAILPALTATDKEGAIREMVASLHAAGFFRPTEVDDVVAAVLRREEVGTTGIGRHLAIPHTRHAGVDRLIGTVAVAANGLDFKSIDTQPVFVLVLIISQPDRPGDHLRALESVVRTAKNDTFIPALRAAGSREAIWNIIDAAQPPWEK